MADVVSSGKHDPEHLAVALKSHVETINAKHKADIISPMTITLGDEFQGVCVDLHAAVRTIISSERRIIHSNYEFYLRYIIYEGKISTPINEQTSYGMLGEGLTKARKLLSKKTKKKRPNVQCHLSDTKQSKLLECLFSIFTDFRAITRAQDRPDVIELMLFQGKSDSEIGEITGIDRSGVWRMRGNWHMISFERALYALQQELYA